MNDDPGNTTTTTAEVTAMTGTVTAAAGGDPVTGLRAVAALGRLHQQLEYLQVRSARERGWSWQDIADALGVSKQAVHKKHAAKLGKLLGKR